MPIYQCGMGDPLDMLAEECCEVIQAIMKFRRFHESLNDQNPATGLNSRNQLVQEIGDLLVCIDILSNQKSRPFFTLTEILAAKEKKLTRLEELFGYKPDC